MICPHCGKDMGEGRKKKSAPNPDVKTIIGYFYSEVKNTKGFAPEIDGADAKRVSMVLKKHPLHEVKRIINHFLRSQKADKVGITLSTALSKHTINTYKQGGEGVDRYEAILGAMESSGVCERGGAQENHSGGDSLAGGIYPAPPSREGRALLVPPDVVLPEMEVATHKRVHRKVSG